MTQQERQHKWKYRQFRHEALPWHESKKTVAALVPRGKRLTRDCRLPVNGPVSITPVILVIIRMDCDWGSMILPRHFMTRSSVVPSGFEPGRSMQFSNRLPDGRCRRRALDRPRNVPSEQSWPSDKSDKSQFRPADPPDISVKTLAGWRGNPPGAARRLPWRPARSRSFASH